MTKMTFHLRVNGGEEQTVKVKTGVYVSAAAAIPAILGIESDTFPLRIELWVPNLLPEYGPYVFYIHEPGGEVGSIIKRWDEQEVIIYSCRKPEVVT